MQIVTKNVFFVCRAFDNCNSTGGYILRNKSQRPLVLLQMTSDTFAKMKKKVKPEFVQRQRHKGSLNSNR